MGEEWLTSVHLELFSSDFTTLIFCQNTICNYVVLAMLGSSLLQVFILQIWYEIPICGVQLL